MSEVDLSCKLCNKWFTYTAPDKESLKEHYATIHKARRDGDFFVKSLGFLPKWRTACSPPLMGFFETDKTV